MKRLVGVIMFISLILGICGCSDGSYLEAGYFYESGKTLPAMFLAYKSDKTEFDVDDVSIDISIGLESEFAPLADTSGQYPDYMIRLVVVDKLDFVERTFKEDYSYREALTTLKEYADFSNKKFYCTSKLLSSNKFKVDFNHIEKIRIPSELFSEQNGKLKLIIYLKYGPTTGNESECGSWTDKNISYRMENGKVILSNG